MIVEQTQGTFPAGNAEYYGLGTMLSFLSGGTTPPAVTAQGQEKLFIGEIQQLGLGMIMDTSMGGN